MSDIYTLLLWDCWQIHDLKLWNLITDQILIIPAFWQWKIAA